MFRRRFRCRTPGATLLLLLVLAASAAGQPSGAPCLEAWTPEHLTTPPQSIGVTAFEYEFLLPASSPPRYLLFFLGALRYDEGRLAEEITRLPDFVGGSEDYVNRSRTSYSYAEGRLVRKQVDLWEQEAWVPASRLTLSHDAGGEETGVLEEGYVPELASWEPRQRATRRYAGTRPVQSIIERWDGAGWSLETRCLLTAEDATTVVLREAWNGVTWEPEVRWRYALPIDRFERALAARTPLLVTDLFTLARPGRDATDAAHAPYERDVWNSDLGLWRPDERLRRLAQSSTTLQTVREAWSTSAATWEALERNTFTFEGPRLTETLQEASTERGPLTARGQVTYTYDAEGLLARVETFTDGDRDGTLDEPAATRLTLTWAPTGTTTDGDSAPGALASLTAVAPTPAHAAARVSFHLRHAQRATLRVFDVLGREVALLADGVLPAGEHTRTLDAALLATGLYLVRLEAGPTLQTRPLVVAH